MKFLVTGASGFVGWALCINIAGKGEVLAAVRARQAWLNVPQVVVPTLDGDTNWSAALQNTDVVVHLAARAHVMKEASADPLAEYRKTNVDGTLNLARQAANAGIRRFVFISSVKVHGEESQPGRPFRESDLPAPEDFYGMSKQEAEVGLRQIAQRSAMELVIIRPPLIYGPGVKANFATLVNVIRRGIPLPLKAIENRRSLVALDNLVDFVGECAIHPLAGGNTFLVSDGHDLSTPQLITRIAHAAGVPLRLFPVPRRILMSGAGFIGKAPALRRLCGNLQVDISLSRNTLGWTPPITVDEGLRRALADIRQS